MLNAKKNINIAPSTQTTVFYDVEDVRVWKNVTKRKTESKFHVKFARDIFTINNASTNISKIAVAKPFRDVTHVTSLIKSHINDTYAECGNAKNVMDIIEKATRA